LKENEDKYRLIAQSTSDLICTITFDLNPVHTYISPSYKYVLGYDPSDLISKSVWDFIHPDDKIGLLPLLKKYLSAIGKDIVSKAAPDKFENLSMRIKDKGGRWHYIECTANMIGKELLLVSKDVTEQKETENKLKENEKLLSLILQSTDDGILVGLKDGSFVYANERFARMWNIPDDMMREKNRKKLHEFVYSQLKNPSGFFTEVDRLYELDKEHLGIVEFKDGRIFERYSVPLKKNGKIWGRVWSFRDVTERKKAEETIRRSAEDWSMTFNAISDAIFLQDINYTIIKANEAFCRMVKLKPEDVVGKRCYRLLHNTDTPWPDCPFEKTKKNNKAHTSEINDPHIGTPLLVTTSPIFNDKGELSGSVHVSKDISQIKKTEKELKDKIHDLEVFRSVAVGRETKMIELKKRIKELEDKLSKH